jgi:alkylated DNA repair dioxygenase AlkB
MTARHARPDAVDLFGLPLIPGLASRTEIITPDEEAMLIAGIDAVDLSPFRFQQWTGKRLTRSYGWHYDFETGTFAPAEPIPDWLTGLRVRAERLAGLVPESLVQALLIRYDPGAAIGWHKDRPAFEHVVGISLGHAAAMRFRRRSGLRFDRVSVPLAPRSFYHLSGDVRHGWEHSIAPIDQPRWSITFRSLADPSPSAD